MSGPARTVADIQKANNEFVERVSAKQKQAVAAEKATGKPQHIVALQRANRVRLKRAEDKREVKALPRLEAYGVIADLLEHPPAYWEGGSPMELLMAVKRHGRYYSLSLLRSAGVPESRRMGELSERQRFALAGVLRGRADEGLAA